LKTDNGSLSSFLSFLVDIMSSRAGGLYGGIQFSSSSPFLSLLQQEQSTSPPTQQETPAASAPAPQSESAQSTDDKDAANQEASAASGKATAGILLLSKLPFERHY
jgi:splicing factor 45